MNDIERFEQECRDYGYEYEDGMGFSGLVRTAADRRQELADEARAKKFADLRRQLALAERRLEIAEAGLALYANCGNWDDAEDRRVFIAGSREGVTITQGGWEPAEKALKEMSEVK